MFYATGDSGGAREKGNLRVLFLLVLVGIAFFTFTIRLYILQVQSGDVYLEKSERVIRKVVTFSAPRGEMFERFFKNREESKSIVSNSTHLVLIAIPADFQENELLNKTHQLEKILRRPEGSLVDKIPMDKLRSNEEVILADNLTPEDMTLLADYHLSFTKFIIKQNTIRYYNYDRMTSHITGYIGLPSQSDLRAGVKSNQWVGKNGIEKYYDDILKGEDGEIVQIKTATGDMDEQKVFKNFTPGNNLVLTIDMELQTIAAESLAGRQGAVVVIKPLSGEILAMVSKPDYDPNILISTDNEARSAHISYMNEEFAEINRAISTKYPPASTFKPLVALAAMEEKQVLMHESYFCPGKFVIKSSYQHLPDSTFHCWSTHGAVDMISALGNSCSVYFYRLSQKTGSAPILRYAKYFMLDRLTNIDIPGEITGFIPSPEWKEKQYRQRWFDGDTVNLSIGQGFIETTLISMTNFFSAIATGGVVYQPRLVKKILYAENDETKEEIEKKVLYELPISATSLKTLRTGLRQVVTGGTATGILNRSYMMPVAGKTGTVQTVSERFKNKTQHAWFIGYGPFQGDIDKTIVVGIIVEYGIAGAVGAGPIAHDIFYAWTKRMETGNKLD